MQLRLSTPLLKVLFVPQGNMKVCFKHSDLIAVDVCEPIQGNMHVMAATVRPTASQSRLPMLTLHVGDVFEVDWLEKPAKLICTDLTCYPTAEKLK